jgi:cytochrome c-type biogenesis protein CcmH/NrfF
VRRRQALAALFGTGAVAAVPRLRHAAAQEREPVPQGAGAAELYDPFRVGRPRDRITDYENDPFIVGLEGRIRCVCGCNLDVYTCRTTDFTCGTSPAMHREVVDMVEQGMTAQEIVDAFIAKHGELVLMAPKTEGFNLLAYFLPGAAVVSVGALLLWALARRRSLVAATAGEAEVSDGLSDDERARLDAEFKKLEL